MTASIDIPKTDTQKTAVLLFVQDYDRDVTAYGIGRRGDRLVHNAMLQQAGAAASEAVAGCDRTDLVVAFDGVVPRFAEESWRFEQSGEGFAERFRGAIEHVLEAGYERVVMIGGDIPDLSVKDIEAAVQADASDVVLGPSEDGGFYLLGIDRDQIDLLDGLDWQTEKLCAQLVGQACERGLALRLLERRVDIDSRRDARVYLPRLADLVRQGSGQSLDRLLGPAARTPASSRRRLPAVPIAAHPDRGPPVI